MSLACSAETAAKVDAEVVKIIKRQHEKAIGILNANKDKLEDAAKILLENETISGEQLMEILDGKTSDKAAAIK